MLRMVNVGEFGHVVYVGRVVPYQAELSCAMMTGDCYPAPHVLRPIPSLPVLKVVWGMGEDFEPKIVLSCGPDPVVET